MKTKYFLVFLVLLLSQICNKALAQKCLMFRYDADGNRIERYAHNNCIDNKGVMEEEDNKEIDDVEVYPNPTEGIFKIIMPESTSYERSYCRIYDVNGIQRIETTLTDVTYVDIGNMPSGTYLLKIIRGDETFSKIIVKH